MSKKYDFSKVKIIGLDGKPAAGDVELYKFVANSLYQHAKDLELVDVAIKIFNKKEVELSEDKVKEIRSLMQDEKSGLLAFARKAVVDYIDSV